MDPVIASDTRPAQAPNPIPAAGSVPPGGDPSDGRSGWDLLARILFGLACLTCLVGMLVFPTYPNYDSYYAMLWGRELLHGDPLFFEGFRVPTEHPLAIAAGAIVSLVGQHADRVWIAGCFAAFMLLVWGVYRLGRLAFTPLVGLVAAGLLITRFDFPFLAARGYIDVPFMAMIVWAAVLETQRPRRGDAVLAILALAGMLRPEAWLLTAVYWCWCVPWTSEGRIGVGRGDRALWIRRVRWTLIAASAPIVWCGLDLIVTGSPIFSLTYTSASAEDLGRSKPLSELPTAIPVFLSSLVKGPVFLASLVGLLLAFTITPRRAVMPAVLLASGVGTFVAVGIAGLSVIERYLIVGALALLIFAAVALGGFTMLTPGSRTRRVWAAASVLLVLVGAGYTATRVNLNQLQNELIFRGEAHRSLVAVLAAPQVRQAMRCGPVTLPNHKLVPDTRWITGLGADRVFARADEGNPDSDRPDNGRGAAARTGVAIVVTGRFAIFKHALTDPADASLVEVPPAGWDRVARSRYYTAYVHC